MPAEVLERLDYELSVVNPKGIAAYFLIVRLHAVGEGATASASVRAEAARPARSSRTRWASRISTRIENGLLFERFLNPERTEMPDIDMDFDDERPRRGHRLRPRQVRRRQGRPDHHVRHDEGARGDPRRRSRARLPVRRARQDQQDDRRRARTRRSSSSLKASTEFKADYDTNPDTKRIVDAASSLEGITRGEGVHAAGVVICRDPLHHHVPVKYDTKGGAVITQYDGPTVADLGLLKMDFLGLRTLTVIADAVENIERNHGIDLVLDDFPLDDAETFALLPARRHRRRLPGRVARHEAAAQAPQPTDLRRHRRRASRSYRPGPMESHGPRLRRAQARPAPITYYDDRLKPILEETYGAIVYQEQVMRISMEMCGFSAAKADKLRKAHGQEDQRRRARRAQARLGRGRRASAATTRKLAERMWDDIVKFAEYAFNKSHSAAYGAHHDADRVPQGALPARVHGRGAHELHAARPTRSCTTSPSATARAYTVLPPDVNSSGKDFTRCRARASASGSRASAVWARASST